MSVTLINGDGNPRVLASQDADWYGALTGQKTCIVPINDNLSATITDSNTIEIGSGVCITKEGRRVQIDEGDIEEIIIPTGTQGVDTYYIIGFHLYINESGQQVAETFVETMESATDTITETTFKEGSSSIYVSLYRVKRSGLLMDGIERIAPIEAGGMANEIYKYNGMMGAKNLIPYPYYNRDGYVNNGITYDVNDDGSVVANGTKTTSSVSQFYFFLDNNSADFGYQTDLFKVGKTYRLTGCPSGGGTYTYRMRLILNYNRSSEGLISYSYVDNGQGVTFTIQSEVKYARLMIDIGNQSATYSVSDLLFKPMLRDAVDTDETYRPYAKTNKQLTDDVSQINNSLTEINTDLSEWIELSDVIYGSIVNTSSSTNGIVHTYNPKLKIGRLRGAIVTNDALTSYSGQNLFQVSQNTPARGAFTVYNVNQNRAHNVLINDAHQIQYADVTAINGPSILRIDYMYTDH